MTSNKPSNQGSSRPLSGQLLISPHEAQRKKKIETTFSSGDITAQGN
jgi:hypothetical protein